MKIKITKTNEFKPWYEDKVGNIYETYGFFHDKDEQKMGIYVFAPDEGSCVFVHEGNYEFIEESDNTQLEERINQLEQQVKELQNRQPIIINYPYPPVPIDPYYRPYQPYITWTSGNAEVK